MILAIRIEETIFYKPEEYFDKWPITYEEFLEEIIVQKNWVNAPECVFGEWLDGRFISSR